MLPMCEFSALQLTKTFRKEMSTAPGGINWWNHFPYNCVTKPKPKWPQSLHSLDKLRHRVSKILPKLAFASNPACDIHRKNLENLNQDTVQFGNGKMAFLIFADNEVLLTALDCDFQHASRVGTIKRKNMMWIAPSGISGVVGPREGVHVSLFTNHRKTGKKHEMDCCSISSKTGILSDCWGSDGTGWMDRMTMISAFSQTTVRFKRRIKRMDGCRDDWQRDRWISKVIWVVICQCNKEGYKARL